MPRTRTPRNNTPQFDPSSPQGEEHLRCYECHGISFQSEGGNEYKADCPFCSGSAFFVNGEEGFFHCKTCEASGNKYTFLQLWYDHCQNKTTKKQLARLAKDRGIPEEAFEIAELAYDASTKTWLIPHRNSKGSMVNLGRWSQTKLIDGGRPIRGTSTCKAHLYNLEASVGINEVYICEGQWDAIALQWLFYANKINDVAVISVPGATTFKEEWGEHFHSKNVHLLYDNDEAGNKGIKRASEILQKYGKCRSIKKLVWPDSFPEKYDIRDFVSQNLKKKKRIVGELKKMFEDLPLHTSKSTGLVRETFESVIEDFEQHILMTTEMRDALLVMCSVVLSNKIFHNPFNPLWIFLVGPSGCGKTLLLQATSDLDMVSFQTNFSTKTLVSGYKTHDGSDNSLLPKIIGKTLVVEDFTGVMTLGAADQEEIHGTLRSVFNGRYEKSFGHIGQRVYPEPGSEHDTCHFSFLAGVTSEIHSDRRANHGERFLKFGMKPENEDQKDQIKAAMKNTIEEIAPEIELRKSVTAFIEHMFTIPAHLPEVPDWVQERIIGLSQIVNMVQAVVKRKSGELSSRPEAGVGSRISQQLTKLSQAVAYTLQKKEVDEEVYSIVQKCGLDTGGFGYDWHSIMLFAVAGADQDEGISVMEIRKQEKVAGTTAQRHLENLLELGVLEFDTEETGRRGQPKQLWKLTPLMQELFERANIPFGKPKPKKRVTRKRSSSPRKTKKVSRKRTTKKGAKKKVRT